MFFFVKIYNILYLIIFEIKLYLKEKSNYFFIPYRKFEIYVLSWTPHSKITFFKANHIIESMHEIIWVISIIFI